MENTKENTVVEENATTTETVSKSETVPEKVSEKETGTGKNYTDEELEKIIQKRLSKELAKQKATADEKAEEALKKIDLLEKKNACLSAGVKPDFTDDAITLAVKLVNDKTDFSAALKSVIGKYPQFAGGDLSAPDKAANTGVKTKNSPAEFDTKALREAFGLK